MEQEVKKRVRGRPFQKGVSGNPKGRPAGALSFKTKWFNFVEKVAETNELTSDEVEQQLIAVAYKSAKNGDYRFWQDIFDRVYGKPIQTTELSGKDGADINVKNIFEIKITKTNANNKLATNRETSDSVGGSE